MKKPQQLSNQLEQFAKDLESEIDARDDIIARISLALTGNDTPTANEVRQLPDIAERLSKELTEAISKLNTEG